MTNDAKKNEIVAYDRAANGYLTEAGRYDTEGRGSGGVTDPLEAQGALTLSQDHSILFAANAGSGTVSVFSVRRSNLVFVSKTPSRGSQPVAVAQFGNLVYVLNSGGAGNVAGFRLDLGAQLRPIKNSTAFLTANVTGGASIAFSPDGRFLLVTERLADNIDAFRVNPDGTLGPIVVNAKPAPGTFSVTFAPNGKAIVSETGPAGADNASAISSYSVGPDGKLTAVSQSVPALANANCWNAITPDGKYVYTSNAGSDSISGFAIGKDGTLTPLGSTVVGNNPAGSTNLDIAVSADGKYVYTLNSNAGNIGMFRIEDNGTLTHLGEAGDLPKSAGFNGIAAI
ncbi:lactonase family protein [Edaphobacter sp. 12200R-103]|nr:lactonase family protein [Edaphobacter sp. 12200R-103]